MNYIEISLPRLIILPISLQAAFHRFRNPIEHIFFYLSNEGVSLVENAAHLGLPVPKKLKEVLEQLHERSEKEDNDDEN